MMIESKFYVHIQGGFGADAVYTILEMNYLPASWEQWRALSGTMLGVTHFFDTYHEAEQWVEETDTELDDAITYLVNRMEDETGSAYTADTWGISQSELH